MKKLGRVAVLDTMQSIAFLCSLTNKTKEIASYTFTTLTGMHSSRGIMRG